MTTDMAAPDCGCAIQQESVQGEDAPQGLTRRGLLRAAMAIGAAAGLSGPLVSSRVAFAAEGAGYNGDVLVVLSLRGGFDGLSALVPVADPAYYAARPNIAVPAAQVLPVDQQFGLHPALRGLKGLYDAGSLALVPAVGQPHSSRSHFQAMAELERAAPGTSLRTGWLDRMVGASGPAATFAGTVVGEGEASMLFAGPTQEMVVPSVDKFSLSGAEDPEEMRRWTTALRRLHVGARTELAGPARAATSAVGTLARLPSAYTPANGATYPKGDLGDALRDVARLVKAKVGLRAVAVDEGDWDMHSGMGSSTSGWMLRKLTELDAALTAFMTDLGSGAGVTLVTVSEFGRRVKENGSGGVDHGAGNAMFVLGGGIAGGRVYGGWPGLAESALDQGDLRGTTDSRVVLAEVLERRCGLNASAVFPNLASTRLGLTRQR